MRLGDNRGTARFREELESWLDEHPPPGARAIDPSLSTGHLPDWAREWQRTLFDAGWLMPRWPAGLGGRSRAGGAHDLPGGDVARQVPRSLNPQGLDVCAPVMVEHGTDEQRERWTLPTLWGDITWCLAVSHEGVPRFQLAQRDRELVVSGREPAPPGAQHADWCLCAAQVVGRIRGGPEDLAVLVVDLRATGVVRPLRPEVTDAAHDPDELIFDEVVLGADAVVNAAGGSAGRRRAAHERTALDRPPARRAAGARGAGDRQPGAGPGQGPVFRDTMAALRVDCDSAMALVPGVRQGGVGPPGARAGDAAAHDPGVRSVPRRHRGAGERRPRSRSGRALPLAERGVAGTVAGGAGGDRHGQCPHRAGTGRGAPWAFLRAGRPQPRACGGWEVMTL